MPGRAKFPDRHALTGGQLGQRTNVGVIVEATLTITNSTILHNSAGYLGGGGIYNYGTLAVTNSTVFGNSVDKDGGGICNQGRLTVTNSTVSGNVSRYGNGGGIYGEREIVLRNCTIAGNTASGWGARGGGLYGDDSLTLAGQQIGTSLPIARWATS
jgi:predicted outer membrane repeat protein